jgi:hypothetical protein
MRTERLVETLYRDLKPVRHQSVVRDAAILCVVGVVELAAFLSAGLVRPDMHYAMLIVVRHGFETPGCACSGGQG